jgi:hypothetical protein
MAYKNDGGDIYWMAAILVVIILCWAISGAMIQHP